MKACTLFYEKRAKSYLLHISEAIASIEKNIQGLTEEQFYNSELVKGFVERKFEIIGEATKRIPDLIKNENPTIPWAQNGRYAEM